LDKTYEVTLVLGQTSTTGDPEGEITPVPHTIPTKEAVEQALEPFRGPIMQTPPAYSAIKIDGQRAYKLAREGKEVKIEPRPVTINQLELVEYSYPTVKLITNVSSGTYIRTLVEDIGNVLQTGAYTIQLRRSTVGIYAVTDAVIVEDLHDPLPLLAMD
jgi:tRNA pseudouridine55 synthase